jgi:hypothetical protein
MKQKMRFVVLVILTTTTTLGLLSCSSKKPVATVKVVQEPETEVAVPCEDQVSDKNFFRGQGIAQSKDLNTAREKARMNANQELATTISLVTRRVSERYVNDAGQSPADYSEIFETLTREVVQKELSNVRVSCNKTMKTTDGMYKVYMAVEADKNAVFDAIDKKAEINRKIETIYQREKFRELFNSEIENLPR